MADTIRPWVGSRVLEIGAGIGNLSRCLAPGREVYWTGDIDEEHIARIRQRLAHRANFKAWWLDLANPATFDPLREQVDTVVCLNVLEHVDDDRTGLANIYSCLQPGGRAILLVPEGASIYGELDRVLGHYRRYSAEEFASRVRDAGFEIERVFGFNRVTRPGWWFNGRILRRRRFSRVQLGIFDRLVWLWRRIDRFIPWPGVSVIVIARKQ
jgi:SAM-dependent methyltransferase